jgi:hypothetical protein
MMQMSAFSPDESVCHLYLQVAVALAMGRTPESGADAQASFQRDLVGQGGAGYAWTPVEGQDIAHFSIAPPPM